MKENLKNPILASKVSIPDLQRIELAGKKIGLRRADFIRLVVLKEANKILEGTL